MKENGVVNSIFG